MQQQVKTYSQLGQLQFGWCVNFAGSYVFDPAGYYTPETAIGLPSDFIALQPGNGLTINLQT